MSGNSAIKPLKSTPNELFCIIVGGWRTAWKTHYAFSRYTAFESVFLNIYNCTYKASVIYVSQNIFTAIKPNHLELSFHGNHYNRGLASPVHVSCKEKVYRTLRDLCLMGLGEKISSPFQKSAQISEFVRTLYK